MKDLASGLEALTAIGATVPRRQQEQLARDVYRKGVALVPRAA